MEQADCSSNEFDLSALSYPGFLAFFFDRPVAGGISDQSTFDLFRSGIDSFVWSNPAAVVSHLGAMCRGFSELPKVYSDQQINQGLWALFGNINCDRFCFDPAVDSALRIETIESMYTPFRDVATLSAADVTDSKTDSCYWMWWDWVLTTFWLSADQYKFDYSGLDGLDGKALHEKLRRVLSAPKDYAALTDDQKLIAEAALRTLLKILALDHRGCQWCALHGLNHLHHPAVPGIVQGYFDGHRGELSAEDIRWVEHCRDGRYM